MSEDTKLTTQLQALRTSAAALNAATDVLNKNLATLEAQLVESQIGLEVWLDNFPLATIPALSENTHEHPPSKVTEKVTEVGFAKLKDGWHIAVRDLLVTRPIDPDSDEDPHYRLLYEPCPVAYASRQERFTAWSYRWQLVDTLHTAVQNFLKTTEQA